MKCTFVTLRLYAILQKKQTLGELQSCLKLKCIICDTNRMKRNPESISQVFFQNAAHVDVKIDSHIYMHPTDAQHAIMVDRKIIIELLLFTLFILGGQLV